MRLNVTQPRLIPRAGRVSEIAFPTLHRRTTGKSLLLRPRSQVEFLLLLEGGLPFVWFVDPLAAGAFPLECFAVLAFEGGGDE